MEPVVYIDSPFAQYLEEAGIDEHAGLQDSPTLAIGEPNVSMCVLDNADIDSPGRSKSRGSPSTPRRPRSSQESGDECIKFALSTSSLLTPRLEDALTSYPPPAHQTLSVTECSARAASMVWEIRQSPSTLDFGNAFKDLWQQADCTARSIGLSIRSLAPAVSAYRALPTQTSVETAYTMVDMTRLFDRLILASQDFDRHAAQLVRSLRPANPYSPRTQQLSTPLPVSSNRASQSPTLHDSLGSSMSSRVCPESHRRLQACASVDERDGSGPLPPRLVQPNRLPSTHSKMLALMQEMVREYQSALRDPLFCSLGAVAISAATGGSKSTAEPNVRDGVFGGIHRANSIARGAGGGTGKHRARPSVGTEGVFGIGTAARGDSPRAVKIGGRRSLSPRRRPLSWSLEYTLPTSDLCGAMSLTFDDTQVEGRETNSEEDVVDKVQKAFESAHGARRLWLLNLTAIIGVPSTRLNRLASHVGSMTMMLRQKLDQLDALQIANKPRMLSTSVANANSLPPWNGHDFAPPSTQSPVAVSLAELEGCHAALCKLLRNMEVQMAATVDEARQLLNMDSRTSPIAMFSCHDSVRLTLEMLLRNYDESRLILRQIVPDAVVGTRPPTELCARPNSPAAAAEGDSCDVHPAILSTSASFFGLEEGSEPSETSPSYAVKSADWEVEQIFEAIVPTSLPPLRSTMTREERIRVKRDQRVSEPFESPILSEVRLIGELKGVLEARRKPLKARDNV